MRERRGDASMVFFLAHDSRVRHSHVVVAEPARVEVPRDGRARRDDERRDRAFEDVLVQRARHDAGGGREGRARDGRADLTPRAMRFFSRRELAGRTTRRGPDRFRALKRVRVTDLTDTSAKKKIDGRRARALRRRARAAAAMEYHHAYDAHAMPHVTNPPHLEDFEQAALETLLMPPPPPLASRGGRDASFSPGRGIGGGKSRRGARRVRARVDERRTTAAARDGRSEGDVRARVQGARVVEARGGGGAASRKRAARRGARDPGRGSFESPRK